MSRKIKVPTSVLFSSALSTVFATKFTKKFFVRAQRQEFLIDINLNKNLKILDHILLCFVTKKPGNWTETAKVYWE